MNEEIFWNLIEEANVEVNSDSKREEFIENFIDKLAELPIEDIIDFQKIYLKKHKKLMTNELWEKTKTKLNIWLSDDGFDYFVAWVISRGEEIYNNILANSDFLINIRKVNPTTTVESITMSSVYSLESMNYIAYYAYERKTGSEDFYDKISDAI